MKNSAWYYQLWRKKLDEHPVQDNAQASWADMQRLLDKHLPLHNPPATGPGRPFGSSLVSKIGLWAAAAVITGAVVFTAVKHPFKNKAVNKKHLKEMKMPVQQPGAISKINHSASSDSLKLIPETPADEEKSKILNNNNPISNKIRATAIPSTPTTATGSVKFGASQPAVAGNKNGVVTTADILLKAAASKRTEIKFIPGKVPAGKQSTALNNNPKQKLPISPASRYPVLTGNASIATGAVDNNGGIGNANAATAISRIKTPAAGNDAASKDGITVNPISKDSNGRQNKPESRNSHQKNKKSIEANNQDGKPSQYNYGLFAGLNASSAGANLQAGLWGKYQLQPKWAIHTGLNLDVNRPLKGGYTHASYSPRDSISFTIADKHKVYSLSLPVNLEYKVSELISISAGPQFSFTVKRSRLISSSPSSYFGPVPNIRDTLNYTKTIDSALNFTKVSTFNVGISGGVSLHFNRFTINGSLLQNITPYQFTNGILGVNRLYYRSFQVGLRYQFKK